jgi:hypothetical protein
VTVSYEESVDTTEGKYRKSGMDIQHGFNDDRGVKLPVVELLVVGVHGIPTSVNPLPRPQFVTYV